MTGYMDSHVAVNVILGAHRPDGGALAIYPHVGMEDQNHAIFLSPGQAAYVLTLAFIAMARRGFFAWVSNNVNTMISRSPLEWSRDKAASCSS